MTTNFTNAKIKLNSEVVETTARGDTRITRIYFAEAATPTQAMTANDMPQPNDEHEEWSMATVQSVRSEALTENAPYEDGTAGMWQVEVVYETPNTGATDIDTRPPPGAAPVANFSISMNGQRVEVDSEDAAVRLGDVYYYSDFGQQETGPDGKPVENPDAEIGTDVLVPSMSCEIIMPESPAPPNVASFINAAGKCNSEQWLFGADGAFPGYLLPKEYGLYLGANVERLSNGNWGVNHSFAFGASELPPDSAQDLFVKRQAWDDAPWIGVDGDPLRLPIRYGYSTRMRRVITQGPPEQIDIKPIEMRIHRNYRVVDFAAALGFGASLP